MISDITPSIKYVGVDDTDIDLFESQYVVPQGISYNSYVILDEKIAIMDTVDHRKEETWVENVKEALAGKTPDYLIVQHMEPDHAGSIARLIEMYPGIQLVASAKAIQMMPQFFEGIDFSDKTIAVKEADTLSLGEHTLQFFMAPMVHWPEVMVTYDQKDKVLFTADGFGKFGALCNDKLEEWSHEAKRYYFNICGKYGMQVQALLKKAAKLDIACICPLHGPVLKENLGYYIGLYDKWSKYEAEIKGTLVAHASIHGGTKAAAEKLAEMLQEKGEEVYLMDLTRTDMSEAIEVSFIYDKMVVAAASYDASVFPVMYDFLHHLQIKNWQNRRVAMMENGSWAPSAAKTMRGLLETMKNVEIVEPVVTIRSTMKQTDLPAMQTLVDALLG